jgi:hypothetical protein
VKAVVRIDLYDTNERQVGTYYLGVRDKLVDRLDEARVFTNGGHAKNAINFLAREIAQRVRYGGDVKGAPLARFFVQYIRLQVVGVNAPEEYTP